MKTYHAKPSEVKRVWYLLDASEAPIGRLATKAASLLVGKGKPSFTKHIDVGDYVVIINSSKAVVKGNKAETKVFYRHSQYPGGIKRRTLSQALVGDPTDVIKHAVRGMLPVNKLREERLNRLKVYAEAEHQHEGQKPHKISVGDSQ